VSPLGDPRLRESLISLALLAASYLAARRISFAIGRTVAAAAARTATRLDDALLGGLKRPVTYILFLLGASFALQRVPAPASWLERAHGVLVVFGIVLVALALLRTWSAVLDWYTTRPHLAESGGPIHEFGPLLGKLGSTFIALVAVIAVLQRFGVNVSSLVVSLGVGSLAIGLAAQDTLANMFAGFILMVDRPFRIGERIKLGSGEVGDVDAIGMRATRIRTIDDTVLIVPNSLLVKEKLVNQSRPTRQITTRVELGVAYGTDLAKAKKVLAEAALASEHVATDRTPVVVVTRFADFSINLLLVFWARDYLAQGLAQSAVHEEIDRRFREEGIEIPFPIRKLIQDAAAQPPEEGSQG
jgi:MscS family membrane protein